MPAPGIKTAWTVATSGMRVLRVIEGATHWVGGDDLRLDDEGLAAAADGEW